MEINFLNLNSIYLIEFNFVSDDESDEDEGKGSKSQSPNSVSGQEKPPRRSSSRVKISSSSASLNREDRKSGAVCNGGRDGKDIEDGEADGGDGVNDNEVCHVHYPVLACSCIVFFSNGAS